MSGTATRQSVGNDEFASARQALAPAPVDHEVIIVGAGFGGLGAAIEVKRLGIEDFVILDRDTGVGGTWYGNNYPGAAVDIASASYSYSFEPNPDWTRIYAPGSELKRYAEHVAEKYQLRRHLRLNTTVTQARWDEVGQFWTLRIGDAPALTARIVIVATGILSQPNIPDIAGLHDYRGTVIHTSRWPQSADLGGKRVAFIGTGATAVQAIPEVATTAARVSVYQRTPIWVTPKPDLPIPPVIRKRPTFSNSYFRAFNRDNVELITAAIDHIGAGDIVTDDGCCRDHDVIVLATGFKLQEEGNFPAFPIYGRGGVEQGATWRANGYESYDGITVAGYPNMFAMNSPFSFTGLSFFYQAELQMTHIARVVTEMRKRDAITFEVKPHAQRKFVAKMDRNAQNTVWFGGQCATANSYYFNAAGHTRLGRLEPTAYVKWRSAHFPLSDYRFGPVTDPVIRAAQHAKGTGA